MTKPNIDDFCEDFDGALTSLVDQVTAEVDADTAGMNEIQLAEYWLASANEHLTEMQRINTLNPVPEFLMEQAQDRVSRQQDRVRAVKAARDQAIKDCIDVVRESLKTQRQVVSLTQREAHSAFDKYLLFEKGAMDALEQTMNRLEALLGDAK